MEFCVTDEWNMFEFYYCETLEEICLGVARRRIKYSRDYFLRRLKLSRTVSTGGVSESSIVIGFGLVSVGQPGWLIIMKTLTIIMNCVLSG